MRILLVEDDAGLGSAVRDHLVASAHAVDWSTTLAEARACAAGGAHGLVLLDLMLPDGNGVDFLRQLRAGGARMPVIILTARDQISDRIEGLNAGADDYLTKPFDLDELLARMAAVSRRSSGQPNPVVLLGELAIDRSARSVRRARREVVLTAREWCLLEALMQRPGAVLSKSRLEESLYSFDEAIESNTIEVHVSRLRKKLGRDAIQTLRGLGYRLNAP